MRKNIFSAFYLTSAFALLMSIHPKAEAGLILEQTRIIWDSRSKQEDISLKNNSNDIYLIQTGVFESPTGQIQSDYFIVTPPLYRLNPNSQQTMKIIPQNKIEQLPKDQESLFYFSAIGIPGVSSDENENSTARLSIGTRLVINLFYRPEGLQQSSDEAIKSLRFNTQNKNLCIENPSEYFVTLSSININNQQYDQAAGVMIAPKSKYSLAVPTQLAQSTKVSWTAINDYGGDSEAYSAVLASGKDTLCQ